MNLPPRLPTLEENKNVRKRILSARLSALPIGMLAQGLGLNPLFAASFGASFELALGTTILSNGKEFNNLWKKLGGSHAHKVSPSSLGNRFGNELLDWYRIDPKCSFEHLARPVQLPSYLGGRQMIFLVPRTLAHAFPHMGIGARNSLNLFASLLVFQGKSGSFAQELSQAFVLGTMSHWAQEWGQQGQRYLGEHPNASFNEVLQEAGRKTWQVMRRSSYLWCAGSRGGTCLWLTCFYRLAQDIWGKLLDKQEN